MTEVMLDRVFLTWKQRHREGQGPAAEPLPGARRSQPAAKPALLELRPQADGEPVLRAAERSRRPGVGRAACAGPGAPVAFLSPSLSETDQRVKRSPGAQWAEAEPARHPAERARRRLAPPLPHHSPPAADHKHRPFKKPVWNWTSLSQGVRGARAISSRKQGAPVSWETVSCHTQKRETALSGARRTL